MKFFRKPNFKNKGFSLLEAIISIAVFGVLASGVMLLVTGPLHGSNIAGDRQRALFLADEGIEASRAIKNDGWTKLTIGDHGLTKSTGIWKFIDTSDISADGFTRVVTVSEVYRDSNDDIVTSGGTLDKRTRQVVVTVSWSLFNIPRSVSSIAYITDWDTYDWRHTTDDDFNPGTKVRTRVVGTGEDASVELLPIPEKFWTPAEGDLITHTSDTDWSGGTFTDTTTIGTGDNASVHETGPRRWITIRTGQSYYHSTDLDFATGGTFDDTTVVDTGDLGAVSLGTSDSWAVISSPVTDHLNGVSMVSSSDGWAVGVGGTIIHWDGDGWTESSSPTPKTLWGVDMIDGNDGHAVGAQGTTIRWDGSDWANVSSPNKTMYAVDMVSSSDGWAVGASGKILQWGGSSWSQFDDTGNDVWKSVHMFSSSDGWIGSTGGDIYHWDGASWSSVTSPTTKSINGIACSSSDFCFAVASQGEIISWDGSVWAIESSPTTSELTDVSMSSANDGWAVGDGGVVIRWNGTSWSSTSSPAVGHLNGVHALSSSEAYTVGNNGEIVQYGRHYLGSGTYISSVYDAEESVVWGHAYWAEFLPTGTDLTIAFRSGDTATPDGSWSAWSGEVTDPFNSEITSPDSRYIQYRATLTTSDLLVAPRLNGIAIYYNEPITVSYFDIKTINDADGWAVGQGGNLARYIDGEWGNYLPSPTTKNLFDVDYSSVNDVWAVGYNGTIIHWDGVSWTNATSPTTSNLYAVDILPDGTGWAVGWKGEIIELRANGNWYVFSSPTNRNLYGVSLSSASEGWAVGASGTALHWDGSDWTEDSPAFVKPLNSVQTVNATFAVTIAQGGSAFHWDGTTWTSVNTTTNNELNDIWCDDIDDCWAVGIQQTFIQWDGVGWSQYFFDNPSNPIVQGVFIPPSGDGWATGEGASLFRYAAYHQGTAYFQGSVIDSGTADTVWNMITWDSVEPLFTGISIAVRTGPTPTPDGSWSDWTSELSDKGGSTITAPAGQYLQYRVTFTTADPIATAILDEIRIINSAVSGQDLYDTDGTAVNDVWVVGRSGTAIHYDGTDWSLVGTPTSKNLRAMDAITSSDAWAVGDQGVIIHWDGVNWSDVTSPTIEDLLSLSFVDATNGWAVGNTGVIIYWNGTSWADVTSPTSVALRGVSMVSTSFGFAVGDSGAIVKWDGANWVNFTPLPTSNNLNGTYMISTTDGWAVGDSGTIIRWDGADWSIVASPSVARLNAIELLSDNLDMWAVGDFGTLLRWHGYYGVDEWVSHTSPTTRHFYGITIYAPTDGWACGAKGAILKDPVGGPIVGTFTSTVLDTDSAASFETVFWDVDVPEDTEFSVALRSGNTSTPDGTWTDWSAEIVNDLGTGETLTLANGRYWQYRLTLTTNDILVTPSLHEIVVTYMLL